VSPQGGERRIFSKKTDNQKREGASMTIKRREQPEPLCEMAAKFVGNIKKYKKRIDIIKNTVHNEIMDINIPFMDKILSLIVSLVSPDQIILFGSYARGDNTEKSDIDLLIIKKDLKDSNEITDLLYRAFYNNKIGIPVDLIVIDYNKYLKLNNEIGFIYKTIKQEGKLLYGTV
jgi:predicted nucleotidyltransferase